LYLLGREAVCMRSGSKKINKAALVFLIMNELATGREVGG
jgi:hypothetical protein